MCVDVNKLLEDCLSIETPGACTNQEHLFELLEIMKRENSRESELLELPVYFGIRAIQYVITYLPKDTENQNLVSVVLRRFQEYMWEFVGTLFHGINVNMICNLASEKYESEKVSDMVMTVLNQEQIERYDSYIQRFDTPLKVGMKATHLLRKLLNITKKQDKNREKNCRQYCLILKADADDFCVYGFANMEEMCDRVPMIHFLDFGQWAVTLPAVWRKLSVKQKCIVRYENGRFMLPQVDDMPLVRARLRQCFEDSGHDNVDGAVCFVSQVIKRAKEQAKGTGVVFLSSEMAESEKNRLGFHNQAFAFGMQELLTDNAALLFAQTSVDGTHILDYDNFRMVSFGTIVDGKCPRVQEDNPDQCSYGDLARGARYNGINTYIRGMEGDPLALGVILSEDGFVNIVTNLEERNILL